MSHCGHGSECTIGVLRRHETSFSALCRVGLRPDYYSFDHVIFPQRGPLQRLFTIPGRPFLSNQRLETPRGEPVALGPPPPAFFCRFGPLARKGVDNGLDTAVEKKGELEYRGTPRVPARRGSRPWPAERSLTRARSAMEGRLQGVESIWRVERDSARTKLSAVE